MGEFTEEEAEKFAWILIEVFAELGYNDINVTFDGDTVTVEGQNEHTVRISITVSESGIQVQVNIDDNGKNQDLTYTVTTESELQKVLNELMDYIKKQ